MMTHRQEVRKVLFNDDDLYEPSYNFREEKNLNQVLKPIQEDIKNLLIQPTLESYSKILHYINTIEYIITNLNFNIEQFKQNYYSLFGSQVNFIQYLIDTEILKLIIVSQYTTHYDINLVSAIENNMPTYINSKRSLLLKQELPEGIIFNLFKDKYFNFTSTDPHFIVNDLLNNKLSFKLIKKIIHITRGSYDYLKVTNIIITDFILTHSYFILRIYINNNYEDGYGFELETLFKLWTQSTVNQEIIDLIAYIFMIHNKIFIPFQNFISLLSYNFTSFYNKLHHSQKKIIDDFMTYSYLYMNTMFERKYAVHVISNHWCDTLYNSKYVYSKMKIIKTMITNGVDDINPTLVDFINKYEHMKSGQEKRNLWLQIVSLIKQEFKSK